MIKIGNFEFDCKYCDFEESYKIEDIAHDKAKEHLINEHSDELRENFSRKQKCHRRGCGAYLKDDLICGEGHDNIDWWAGYLISMAHGLTKK